jgi:hypothetical protein
MGSLETEAHIPAARNAKMCARGRARNGAWRRVPGPFWDAVEAGEEAVEGEPTAESSAASRDADRERLSNVPSRSS